MSQALAAAPASEEVALPDLGAAFGGGYFTGIYQIDGQRFALITSGAAGELKGKWNGSMAMVSGATSRADGLANTKAMAEAGSELAQQALALAINGFTDWYIPSRDEQELQYRAFKPTDEENYADGEDGINPSSLPAGTAYTDEFPAQTTITNFCAGGADALHDWWCWSSTQHEGFPAYAWGQDFDDGYQYCNLKSNTGHARAVRRLPI